MLVAPKRNNRVVEAIRSIALKVFGEAFYKKLQKPKKKKERTQS
jgi:hypothetical protein